MGGDLLIPRCEVYWGDENITFFKGAEKWPGSDGPQPLVYNVKVNIHEEGQTPSGSMSWNPSALAYREYERLVRDKYDKTIVVKYYYPGGPAIAFSFVWAGQTESYGRNMDITVRLYSELDGLCEGYIKSFVTVENGVTLLRALDSVEQLFGIKEALNSLYPNNTTPKTLISFAGKVGEELGKVKVLSNYSEGTTFSQSVENIVGQNGNIAFFHNLMSGLPSGGSRYVSSDLPGVVIFPPYSWLGKKLENGKLVEIGYTKDDYSELVSYRPPGQRSNSYPTIRFGYFLGPAMIDSMTKTSEWSPGQKTRRNTRSTNPKVQRFDITLGETGFTFKSTQDLKNQVSQNAKNTNGAGGTFGSMSRPGMRLEGNEEGEFKKHLLQRERTAKLSANLFMCPALTGIKPCDIIFIPGFSGGSMEDWIVNSVEYEQSDGGVNLSIQASRTNGLGTFMNPQIGKNWLDVAVNTLGLVGKYGSIENWVRYAWSLDDVFAYAATGPGSFKLNSQEAATAKPVTQSQPTTQPATQPILNRPPNQSSTFSTNPIPNPNPAAKPLGRALTAAEQREFNSAVIQYPGNSSLVKVSTKSDFYRYLTSYGQKPKSDSNSAYATFGLGGMVIANQWFEYFVANRLF
jgi:hypothetical protein